MKIGCCMSMIKAQEAGTDNEAYGELVYILTDGAFIGYSLPPITFCPWCGKEIKVTP